SPPAPLPRSGGEGRTVAPLAPASGERGRGEGAPPAAAPAENHAVNKPAEAEAPAGPRPIPGGAVVPTPQPAVGPRPAPIPAMPSLVPGKPADKGRPPRPIHLSARVVEAHILRTATKNELDRLWTEGTVHVQQEGATPTDRGVDIHGDTLQLTRTPDGN